MKFLLTITDSYLTSDEEMELMLSLGFKKRFDGKEKVLLDGTSVIVDSNRRLEYDDSSIELESLEQFVELVKKIGMHVVFDVFNEPKEDGSIGSIEIYNDYRE